MSRRRPAARPHAWTAWALSVLVLLIGTASTLGVTNARQRQVADESTLRLSQQRQQVVTTFEQALDRIRAVLVGASSFVAASDHVTEQEWLRYVSAVGDLSGQGLEGIGVVVPVPWDQRAAFVEQLRDETPEAVLRTTETPHELAIVTGASKGPQFVGFDVAVESERRTALDRARDTGDVVVTEPVHRLSDEALPVNERPWTYVLYAPIYRTGQSPARLEDRRRELVGWVTSSVTATNVVQMFGTTGMDVAVFDGRDAQVSRLMATTRPVESLLADARSDAAVVEFGGHAWTLGTSPQVDATADSGSGIVLVAGLIVTFAIACLTMQLALGRHRLQGQVDEAVANLEAANERLARQALHDALTRLPNRAMFEDRLDHALERSQRTGERHAVLFLDVDRFKSINDVHGHAAGDQVLRAIAARLVESLRSSDTAARLGGDEFVVLSEHIADDDEARTLATRVKERLDGTYDIDGIELHLTVSVGHAVTHPGDRPADVLGTADESMYRAKQRCRPDEPNEPAEANPAPPAPGRQRQAV